MCRIEDDDDLNDRLVADLIDRLEGCVHVPLSYAEKTQLATVAQATLEVCHGHAETLQNRGIETDCNCRPSVSDVVWISAACAF